MPLTASIVVPAYLLLISLITFAAFAWDKHCSRTGRQRIREETLLGMAAIGGTIGALTGQHWLRHKTRKEPFRTMLYMIAGIQALLVVAVWFIGIRHMGPDWPGSRRSGSCFTCNPGMVSKSRPVPKAQQKADVRDSSCMDEDRGTLPCAIAAARLRHLPS